MCLFGVGNLGKVSNSLTHEQITRRGIVQSVVRYFYDKPDGKQKINLDKINNEYYDLTSLYFDYYRKYICSIPVASLIKTTFEPYVALVDLDPATKDLPYAHFDAEKFKQSNDLVINFTNSINIELEAKNYEQAQVNAAKGLYKKFKFSTFLVTIL